MFTRMWRSWLRRLRLEVGARSRRRHKQGLASGQVSAELTSGESFESRLLLSASSATHLVFTVQPTNTTAGTSFSVTVSVENSSGAVVTSNDSTIRLTVQGPGRFASDGRTMTATAVDGVATFDNLTLDKAGTYTLEASIGHRHRVSSDSFTVSPDTSGPEQLAFLRQVPSFGTVDQPLRTIEVAVEDQFGNVIKTDDSSVTLSVNSGPATSFSGSTPSPYTVSTVNGVAKFNDAILGTAGTYTLAASDSNSAVSSAISNSITINEQGQHQHDWGWSGGEGQHHRFG
jgi:hypothetical protein